MTKGVIELDEKEVRSKKGLLKGWKWTKEEIGATGERTDMKNATTKAKD